jgi:hypothetical protein
MSVRRSLNHAANTLASAAVVAVIGVSGAGCASCERAGQGVISLMGGTINDPANKSLRRGMLAFGLDRACTEMMAKPAGLREGVETNGAATNPVNGRFFAKTCALTTADDGDAILSFSGTGWSWASGVRKITFDASAVVRFDQDFLMSGDDLYGYLRTKDVSTPQVTIKVIESTPIAIADKLTGFGERYARALLTEKLRNGMTVRRRKSGETDFRAGIVELGTWPTLAYATPSGAPIFNDRAEVHEQQRDFIGPIDVPDDSSMAVAALRLDGAESINVLVIDDPTEKTWVDQYLTIADATLPPTRPLQQLVARQGTDMNLQLPNKGRYWIVLDNTSTIAGGVAPPGHLLDDRAAVVSYAVAVGAKGK